MTRPAPNAAVLVLRRAPALERQALSMIRGRLSSLWIGAICYAVMAGLLLALAFTGSWFYSGFAVLILGCAAAQGKSIRDTVRWRNVEQSLHGMELVINRDGVTYRGPAGNFPAPWTAVRAIAIRGRQQGLGRRAAALFVEVDGWGGPLAVLATGGRPCSLRLPLHGLGTDPATITRAVHELSAGRVTLRHG